MKIYITINFFNQHIISLFPLFVNQKNNMLIVFLVRGYIFLVETRKNCFLHLHLMTTNGMDMLQKIHLIDISANVKTKSNLEPNYKNKKLKNFFFFFYMAFIFHKQFFQWSRKTCCFCCFCCC